MRKLILTLAVAAPATLLSACGGTGSVGSVTDQFALAALKTEYRTQPIGIDVTAPRFSWQMSAKGGAKGLSQSAYRIRVTDENGAQVWDSGKQNSSEALHITYKGKPLSPRTQYTWQLTVWDSEGDASEATSTFETGLLDTSLNAWNGATWIGGNDNALPLYGDYLPLFRIGADITIAEGGTAGGIVYAANDPRMMDKYKNIYQVESGEDESYFKIELDVEGVENGEPATLNFYRAGYTPDDNADTPVKSFDIKQSLINAYNRFKPHHLLINNEFGNVTVQLDGNPAFWVGAESEEKSGFQMMFPPLVEGATVQLNPLGHNHDYVTYGMLSDIGVAADAGTTVTVSNLTVSNMHTPHSVLFNVAEHGAEFAEKSSQVSDTKAGITFTGSDDSQLIVVDTQSNGMPQLRTEFDVAEKAVSKARLYVTARGIYEYYVNGEKVSNDYYNPGLTQYNLTHLYQSYDVTSAIQKGENAMGARLGEGWWSGMLGFGNTWNGFGDRQSLLAQLVITYEDGSESIVVTQPGSWQFSDTSPVVYGSLSMGEVYDARIAEAQADWATPSFEGEWEPAVEISLEETKAQNVQPNMMRPAQTLSYDNMKLIGQIGEPAREFTTVQAKSVEEVRPGVFVYDLGQNIVGVPRLHFQDGKSGEAVTVRFAEMLYPDLPESGPNVGMIMTENYRAALSQDIYIMTDGEQTFEPHFTSHGFQYIEVTGIEKPLPLEAVNGVVVSSVQALTASYECSDDKVNQLWSNLTWSNVDNFLSVPTDCPQRNERMGWSGDINVFAPTATYVSDASQFMRRHLQAMRDTQADSGRYADVAPVGGGFGGVLWGVAGITVAWETYFQYGDKGLLAEHYASMNEYMTFLHDSIDSETGLSTDSGLGDWLGPQNNQLGADYLATAYHIYALDIMAQVAAVLGDDAQAREYRNQYDERKAFFNDKFVNDEQQTVGLVGGPSMFNPVAPPAEWAVADTQTSFAVGLAMNAFNEDNAAAMAEKLTRSVSSQNVDDAGKTRPAYSLMTGFIGTAWISKALSENGYTGDAYRLLLNDQYPSWLYPIDQGATTIWERLNGYTVEDGFGGNNSMNSFNHYSFGAIGEWLISHSGGIQRLSPGFKTFALKPEFDPQNEIDWVKAEYDSPYGKISSHWQVKDGKFDYRVTIPANTTATISLPGAQQALKIDGENVTASKFVTNVSRADEMNTFSLGSGTYQITGAVNE